MCRCWSVGMIGSVVEVGERSPPPPAGHVQYYLRRTTLNPKPYLRGTDGAPQSVDISGGRSDRPTHPPVEP
jgi:hypothetical protein